MLKQLLSYLTLYNISLWVLAAFLIYAGYAHFKNPKFFLKIVPPYVPAHKLMVDLSGIAEIICGIGLLIPATRPYAAWTSIALFVAVFPANLYMATSEKFASISATFRWLRLPLQGVLIWWVYQYK
jgi:uncharacterized membrane protein